MNLGSEKIYSEMTAAKFGIDCILYICVNIVISGKHEVVLPCFTFCFVFRAISERFLYSEHHFHLEDKVVFLNDSLIVFTQF